MSEPRQRQRARQAQQAADSARRPEVGEPASGDSSGARQGGGGGGGGTGRSGGADSGTSALASWFRLPKVAIALVAAVAIGVGAFFAMPGGGDSLSQQEIDQRVAQYEAMVAAGGVPMQMVAAEDLDRAIASLPEDITTEQREELRAEVDAGRVQLAWLTIWDTHVEDGDRLRFESSVSFPIEVTALNRRTTIAIPMPPEGSVLVTGVHDGGGGITIGLESGAARIEWPTMQPGDTLDLPVRPAY